MGKIQARTSALTSTDRRSRSGDVRLVDLLPLALALVLRIISRRFVAGVVRCSMPNRLGIQGLKGRPFLQLSIKLTSEPKSGPCKFCCSCNMFQGRAGRDTSLSILCCTWTISGRRCHENGETLALLILRWSLCSNRSPYPPT